MKRRAWLGVLGAMALGGMLSGALQQAAAEDRFIIVQSTTSTEQSGLFGHLLPLFQAKSGIEVRVVAVGTGQAIKNAMNGDGDVLLVHARPDEERFVAEGWGVQRFDVMHNDFVVVGPRSDPAGVKGGTDTAAALKRIAQTQAPFASRGDDSGTHKAELELWQAAGVETRAASGTWYRETGSGMGPTLNMAASMSAYALTDRGTWLSFKNRGELEILVEGDSRLFNQYGVILVNPARHPNVKADLGQRFVDWLTGSEGQQAIAGYRINGERLFFPNAKSSAS